MEWIYSGKTTRIGCMNVVYSLGHRRVQQPPADFRELWNEISCRGRENKLLPGTTRSCTEWSAMKFRKTTTIEVWFILIVYTLNIISKFTYILLNSVKIILTDLALFFFLPFLKNPLNIVWGNLSVFSYCSHIHFQPPPSPRLTRQTYSI